ncbi:hypothetical protein L1885_27215, partial [Streptomyces fuscigenes]|nr:hypothetical protein [Streptomyces fuscigenes]
LRRGELFLITHDHSMVQAMVDAGQLDPAEAASHPQRALLLRGRGRRLGLRPGGRGRGRRRGRRADRVRGLRARGRGGAGLHG